MNGELLYQMDRISNNFRKMKSFNKFSGFLIKETVPFGESRSYMYISITYPDKQRKIYTYDAKGNLNIIHIHRILA